MVRNSVMILGLSLAALLPGCGGEEGEPTGSTCPDDSSLTYESFGQAFFATNCLSCHGSAGPESPKFDTVEQIRASADAIDRQAASGPDATNTLMPESGSVTTEERKQLGEWLACDAP